MEEGDAYSTKYGIKKSDLKLNASRKIVGKLRSEMARVRSNMNQEGQQM